MIKWKALLRTHGPAVGYLLLGILLAAALCLNFSAAVEAQTSGLIEEFYRLVMNVFDKVHGVILVLAVIYAGVFFVRMRFGRMKEFEYAFPVRRGVLYAAGYAGGAITLVVGYLGCAGLAILSLPDVSALELLLVCLGRCIWTLTAYSLLFALLATFRGVSMVVGAGLYAVLVLRFEALLVLIDRICYAYLGVRAQGSGTQIADSLLVFQNLPGSFDESIRRLIECGFEPITDPVEYYGIFWPICAIVLLLISAALCYIGFRGFEAADISRRYRRPAVGYAAGFVIILSLLLAVIFGRDLNKRVHGEVKEYLDTKAWTEEEAIEAFEQRFRMPIEGNENSYQNFKKGLERKDGYYNWFSAVIAEFAKVGTVPYYATYSTMGDMSAQIVPFFIIVGGSVLISVLVVIAEYRYGRKRGERI